MSNRKTQPIWKILLLALGLVSLSACGFFQANEDSADSEEPTVQETSSEDDLQPDIHTNVPPPADAEEIEDKDILADTFFDKKEILDGFNEALQDQIRQNLNDAAAQIPKLDLDLAGSEDAVATGPVSPYLTLFGHSLPMLEMSGCDPTGGLICLDEPQPLPGATSIYTIAPAIEIKGRVYLPDLAVFDENAVLLVSSFNTDTGNAPFELPIALSELEASAENPEIANFETAALLGAEGHFSVVITAFKNNAAAETNDLVSKMVDVYRTPKEIGIEFEEARPVLGGVVAEASVEEGAIISAEELEIAVRLVDTPFSPGIQIRFINTDADGQVRNYVAVGGVASDEAKQGSEGYIYRGSSILHQGQNNIRILAINPELQAALGENAPAPVELNFTIENYFGRPIVKVLSPESSVVPYQSGRMNFEFCYTVIPERVAEGATESATNPETCSADRLSSGQETCMKLNGRLIGGVDDVMGDRLDPDSDTGTYRASITPSFGVNTYEIYVSEDDCATARYATSGSFVAGEEMALIEGVGPMDALAPEQGAESQGRLISDYWTKRGVHVDVDKALIEGDLKDILQKYLDREEISQTVMDLFRSTATSPTYTCPAFLDPSTGKPTASAGDTTIEFLPETFKLGLDDGSKTIEIESLKTTNNGMLELVATLNGLVGEADLRPIENNGYTVNGLDLGFIPLTVTIKRLKVHLGIHFPLKIDLDKDGIFDVRGLDIKLIPIDGDNIFILEGGGVGGRVATVNSARNGLAAGLELFDYQTSLIHDLMNTTLGATLACGIEEGLNHTQNGLLGSGAANLAAAITEPADSIFRLPFDFDLLGKNLGLEIAYDLLASEIEIDSEGLHARNVPVRITPGLDRLLDLASEYAATGLGMVLRPPMPGELSPRQNISNKTHKIAAQLGEDVINMALAAAVQSGAADLDVNPRFWQQLGAAPSLDIAPTGAALAPGIDVNLDGGVNEIDAKTPVQLSVRFNAHTPPMVSFLTEDEVARLADAEAAANTSGGDTGGEDLPTGESDDGETPPETPSASANFFVPGEGVMRLGISNLELSAYRLEAIPASQGGERTYCQMTYDESPELAVQGFCQAKGAVLLFDDNDIPNDTPACDTEENLVSLPHDNGEVISQNPVPGESSDRTLPIYRVKVQLVAHAKVAGMSRGSSAGARLEAELLGEPAPVDQNRIHLKFAPSVAGDQAFVAAVEVVENNTNLPDTDISGYLTTLLNGALADNCSGVNEIVFPLPDQINFNTASPGLLSDLGLEAIDLGATPENRPQVFIERLHLNALVLADLLFGSSN